MSKLTLDDPNPKFLAMDDPNPSEKGGSVRGEGSMGCDALVNDQIPDDDDLRHDPDPAHADDGHGMTTANDILTELSAIGYHPDPNVKSKPQGRPRQADRMTASNQRFRRTQRKWLK